jgi:cyclase
VAIGGAAGVQDFVPAVESGASAVAAGSMFVFQGPHRAVLISYPTQQELKEKFFDIITES